ncbi:hypothetical protein BK011_09510 [Tenericutes bacterium MZ-XQ]|nr:hypothetical protein BK011_09510 [Tenericutes bacterium MZ-XQ]
MLYNRKDLVKLIRPWVEHQSKIIAAWEGGSAATNRMDEYSDLDLSLVVSDDQVEHTFDLFEAFLKDHFTIIRKYRVPEPTWHGLSQCFFQISDVTDHLYLDIAVIKESLPDKLMEKDRHGIANVWFDRKHIYDGSPSSEKDMRIRGKKLYESVTQSDFLMILEINKGIARKQFIDVFPTYFTFISRHLGIMLNLKHRPERADFNLRYGRLDYSKEDVKLIEDSFKVSDIESLSIQFSKIQARYQELKTELFDLWSK